MSAALLRARDGLGGEFAKLVLAGGIFIAIFGSYLAVTRTREAAQAAAAPLPGATPPAGACTLWFVGSSTVFRWASLQGDFAPWDARDRGINGATLPQLLQAFGNEPQGPAPAAIVFYAGENDIAAGARPEAVFSDFVRFMAAKTRRFGALPIIVVSAKPTPTRWANLPQQNRYNAALRRLAERRADMAFVDIRPLMFAGGALGPYYVEDGIHMNAAGYARWTAQLRPAMARLLPPATVRTCLGQGAPR